MVNLSVRQLYGLTDIDRFAQLVRQHVDPRHVELEVTEGALMSDPPSAEVKLVALNAHGFRLAIDDFGTGYSSLSRIKDLPFDTLKVDRMFIAGIRQPGKGEIVTQTILQLAQSLSLSAIAEGIETNQQREVLRDWGCEYGQGFWFSPGLPAAELEALLRASGVSSFGG